MVPYVRSMGLSRLPQSILDSIAALFPPGDWARAGCIVWAESRGDVNVVGKAGEQGPWQLYPGHAWRFARRGWSYYYDARDPWRSTVIAREIVEENGWGPWTTLSMCW